MIIDMVKKGFLITFIIVSFTYLASTRIESATNHIVINEVQIAGASASDDFIELYNPTNVEYSLAGHRLVKRTETGTSDSSIKAFGEADVIPAYGYYLWANSGGSFVGIANSTTAAVISADNGVALRNGAEDGGLATIVDSVGWGAAANEFVEGTVFATNPEANTSLERSGDDTNNNSVDFVITESPNPGVGASPSPSPTDSPSPSPTESPSPSPTESPSPSPSPTESPSPSPSPTESPSPSPSSTPTESPSPTESPTPEPSVSPSPSPTVSPTPVASPSPSPTVEPVMTKVLGSFGFGSNRRVCYLKYEKVWFGFMRITFPKLECVRI